MLLKEKNAQLLALQTKIIEAPRAERKALKAEAEQLDREIAVINQGFLRPVDAAVAGLAAAESSEAATQALVAIKEMTSDVTNPEHMRRCEEFRDKGALDGIHKVFEQFMSDDKVAEEGCNAVSHLARSKETRALMGETMAPHVMTALITYSDNADVIKAACRGVTNIALQNEANAALMMQCGTAVVAAMQNFPEDRKLQLFGCLALNNLAINHHHLPEWTEDAVEYIALLVAKTKYSADFEVQKWAGNFLNVAEKRKAVMEQ